MNLKESSAAKIGRQILGHNGAVQTGGEESYVVHQKCDHIFFVNELPTANRIPRCAPTQPGHLFHRDYVDTVPSWSAAWQKTCARSSPRERPGPAPGEAAALARCLAGRASLLLVSCTAVGDRLGRGERLPAAGIMPWSIGVYPGRLLRGDSRSGRSSFPERSAPKLLRRSGFAACTGSAGRSEHEEPRPQCKTSERDRRSGRVCSTGRQTSCSQERRSAYY